MTTPPSVPTPRPHEPQEPPTEWVAGIPAQRTAADGAAAGLTAPSAWSAAGSGGAAPGPWPVAGAGGEVPPAAPPAPREASGQARPPKVRRWPWAGAGLVVGLAVGAGIGAGGAATTTSAAAAPATVTVTAPAPAPRTVTVTAPAPAPQTVTVTAAPTTEAAPAGPLTTFSDGVYEVGTDIVAGKYKTPGPGSTDILDSCYMEVGDGSGSLGGIDQNDNLTGPGVVTVKKGKVFKVSGGCTWTKVG
jgi:hypothetical protein